MKGCTVPKTGSSDPQNWVGASFFVFFADPVSATLVVHQFDWFICALRPKDASKRQLRVNTLLYKLNTL